MRRLKITTTDPCYSLLFPDIHHLPTVSVFGLSIDLLFLQSQNSRAHTRSHCLASKHSLLMDPKPNMPNQDGLEWVEGTFGTEPRWTKEPDIEIVKQTAQKHLGCTENTSMEVAFHAQGAFNKLYRISTGDSTYLMRVSLPVDPRHKTASEVATIEFVRQETDMPLPRIITFNSDNQNELGFEWILMEMMPGTTLRKRWRKMTWEAKEEVVKQLVKYQAQLFEKRFAGIGNIFMQTEAPDKAFDAIGPFVLGRIVSLIFFWGDHLTHDVSHGPFKTSNAWLRTRLQFAITDQERILGTTEDEDEIEDAEFAKDLAGRMLEALSTVFPPDDTAEPEPSILFHDDLSMQNVLVDDTGELTAIIDWECVSAVPLWRACQLPQLLEGPSREEEPQKVDYGPESDTEEQDPEEGDNEGITTLYWRHLQEYEKTQLRKLFVDEMDKLKPEWVSQMKNSTLEADFEKAVHNTDNGWANQTVNQWLNALLKGEVESLSEKMGY